MDWVIAAVIILVINYVIAGEMRNIAESKGCVDSGRYFWFSFLLGLPGWIMVAALPNKKMDNLLISLKDANKENQHNSPAPSSPVQEKKEIQNSDADATAVGTSDVQNTDKKPAPNPGDTVDAIAVDPGKIKCTKCGTIQNSNRLVCWECGARFAIKE